MRKKIVLRALVGFPIGIAISYVITIGISLVHANGYYAPCVPQLAETMGSVINAVILQAVLSGVLGSAFAACSLIWEMEDWSIVKQTGLYFLITSIAMMTVAYFNYWMEHSLPGFLFYMLIFVSIFIVVWLTQYMLWRKRIKDINSKI